MYVNAVAESGRNLVRKHQNQLSVVNEQADVGRGGRTCLARPNSQARMETGINLVPVQLTTSRIVHHIRLIYTLLKVLTIHTQNC